MKAEFDNLVETLKRWDLYQIGDEVDMALTDLSNKIAEVEKRMEIATICGVGIRTLIGKFTDQVDKNEPINLSVNDHDAILNGADDVTIALDLNDDMCIKDNWHGLFKPEVAFSFESSWGRIDCDINGNVIEVDGDREINGEKNYLFEIARVDIEEYAKFCSNLNITHGECEDILSVGFWRKDGVYGEPDHAWRESIFKPKEEEAPTELCKTPQTHEFVKDIIAKLKVIDVDGETMEYILEQVGMKEQMAKQLTNKVEID